MQVGGTKVEELAWLIKDNLFSKHLVLSVEEMFVELLSPLSGAEVLELQPMMSYQRMLLHRLADVFGLAHQSVGEGDDRHLLVERCVNSSIPAVLVSEVLDGFYEDSPEPSFSKQLLKRTAPSPGETGTHPCSSLPVLSLAERQAAYLAARKRIFSDHWMPAEDGLTGGTTRPRNVPVVARRMIAHALGKAVSLEGSSLREINRKSYDTEVDLGKKTEQEKDLMPHLVHIEEKIKDLNVSPASASKRLFAQAISLSVSSRSPKCFVGAESVQDQEKPKGKISGSVSTRHVDKINRKPDEIEADCAENSNMFGLESSKFDQSRDFRISSSTNSSGNSLSIRKTASCDMPGRAARRILVQALGLQVPDKSSSTWDRVQKQNRRHSSDPSNGTSSQLSVLTS